MHHYFRSKTRIRSIEGYKTANYKLRPVDDLIAENDRVVVRWRLLGTHKGDFRGIAPTGRAIALKGIAIYRVKDGKLMERWVVSDLHGLLEEIRGYSPSLPRH